MKRPVRLVVIGGVAAGSRAAAKARRDDPAMEIILLTQEAYISYAACGFAYYIGGVVTDRAALFSRSPETFRTRDNIDIRLRHRVEAIDAYDNCVRGVNLDTGEAFALSWDRLVIATGASPIVPPIEGVDLPGVFRLHSIPDADAIRDRLAAGHVTNTAVIGAGYIGVELAEVLAARGIGVTLFELRGRVLPGMLDADMAAPVQAAMEQAGIRIMLNADVSRFVSGGDAVRACVSGGVEYPCDIAIVAAGVRPNVELARTARITLGPTGAIRTDSRLETNIRGVYAAGDCAETVNIVSGKPFWLPLGSTANKMGRVAGANTAGGSLHFPGVAGTAIVKVFDLAVARTGLSEGEATDAGFFPIAATVTVKSRPGYYPGGGEATLTLIADRSTRSILGASAVGTAGVDKLMDTVAAALTGKLTVDDCLGLDLAYTPPFSPALGGVIVAAQVLDGKLG